MVYVLKFNSFFSPSLDSYKRVPIQDILFRPFFRNPPRIAPVDPNKADPMIAPPMLIFPDDKEASSLIEKPNILL